MHLGLLPFQSPEPRADMQIQSLQNSWVLVVCVASFLVENAIPRSQYLYCHYLSWVILYCSSKLFVLRPPTSDYVPAKIPASNELAFVISNVIASRSLCDVEWLTVRTLHSSPHHLFHCFYDSSG